MVSFDGNLGDDDGRGTVEPAPAPLEKPTLEELKAHFKEVFSRETDKYYYIKPVILKMQEIINEVRVVDPTIDVELKISPTRALKAYKIFEPEEVGEYDDSRIGHRIEPDYNLYAILRINDYEFLVRFDQKKKVLIGARQLNTVIAPIADQNGQEIYSPKSTADILKDAEEFDFDDIESQIKLSYIIINTAAECSAIEQLREETKAAKAKVVARIDIGKMPGQKS